MATVAELQAALRQSQEEAERYRLLLQHSGEVSWMADCASLRLTWLSPAAGRQFGYTLESAQALAAGLLQQLPARLARHANGDPSRLRLLRETELPHADGRLLPVEIESTLILDEQGAAVSVVGVVRDLSARRELAAQQKKFASMLSHEFRTPLSTIDGAVQRLEMTGAHHDEGTRKRYRKIQTAVDRMLAMLDEYLSPERMASIGRERQPNEISPATLLESVAEQARRRRDAVSVRTDALPQWMRCDPAGVRLCLEILVDNAIKYTSANTPIELIGKMASEGGVEFLVRDHGAGVPAAELAHVFDKSFRGSNAVGVAGSGLGLYMARAVVDVHGGTLTATNVSESGAEFRIWLPVGAAAGKSLARSGGSSDNSLDAS
ncbi:PAS domain-containing sensor histidine kinase [Duganella sp. BJB488]|uniref:PAS domain-containing sensor histidine kinase n=1 Tax=unclassified Duganella TaxID=2636909 RepID=UPI000E343FB9|nr:MULTISPECIES: PAS domain-containing sensor histidine kinase [unclassified Duganella]RFP24589.1 PAS domain-containing sensor histidine kinase [Duganella sp. BJB489]RFP26949.1 PAS domain-containing sensor histidine kinase [Duganella sp. BJB488]RFP34318.1 PAS domain-containing sensor histidine kinase [Duganella sp. BJB480]